LVSGGRQQHKVLPKICAYRKNFNTILEIEASDGVKVTSFIDIANAGKTHFHSLFKESNASNIGEIMKVVSLFPRFFDDEMNLIMDSPVTKSELKSILSSFKKAKIPGLMVGLSNFILVSMIF
jgi:hypothetical protein